MVSSRQNVSHAEGCLMRTAPETVRRDGRIPDAFWARLPPLVPARTSHPLGCHRPRIDARKAREAMFLVRRPGCQWHARNETGICSSSAAHRRCQAWVDADVCVALGAQGLVADDALPGLAWAWRAMAGAMTPAPLGGAKGGKAPHGSWQDGHHAPSPHRRLRRTSRPRGRRRPAP
jgi:hypothetical protein